MIHTIKIRGVVGIDVLTEDIIAQLQNVQPDDEIIFDTSSPGGSVLTGFEIFNAIRETKAAKKVFSINGLAASITSIIVMAGDEIEMSELSLFMIHKASVGVEGNSEQIQQQSEILNKIDALLIDTYLQRNEKSGQKKLKRPDVENMLSKETWLTSAEALELGFIDRVVNKISDVSKIAAQTKTIDMNHLLKLKKLLAQGGRIEITKQTVDDAIVKALNGRKVSALSDEETNEFLVAVKGLIENQLGGTLTDDELNNVNTLLNESIDAQRETELAQTTDGKIDALQKTIDQLANIVKSIGETTVANGQAVENLSFEITNIKKGVRSFGKKPFVNESTKMLNIGAAYVDPYAKHRAEMAAIEAKNRQDKTTLKP